MNGLCLRVQLLSACLASVFFSPIVSAQTPGASAAPPILQITTGTPIKVAEDEVGNSASVECAPNGTLIISVPSTQVPGHEGQSRLGYRLSTDGGQTWSAPYDAVDAQTGDESEWAQVTPTTYMRPYGPLYPVEGQADTFTTQFQVFAEDLHSFRLLPVKVTIPNVELMYQLQGETKWYGPLFSQIIQASDGSRLGIMWGRIKGQRKQVILLARSTDLGRTWQYVSTVAQDEQDRTPQWPGEFNGYAEPALAQLPDGGLLAVIRAQASHLPPDFKPLYACWSADNGQTWTEPTVTEPALLNISPKLAVLDNGVVACLYGRPGFHVAFSVDNGHTWPQRVSFTHLTEPMHTGQNSMAKIGPNQLVAIGAVPGMGTCVYPISVDRVADPQPGPFTLTGQITDTAGTPISGAVVQLGPQQYPTADEQPVEYHAIDLAAGHPRTSTDGEGRYRFDNVQRGGAVLTIEAAGFMPIVKHVALDPQSPTADAQLSPGAVMYGQVLNDQAEPVPAVCVLLNQNQHVHTDPQGVFSWPVQQLPPQVTMQLIKVGYVQLQRTVACTTLTQPFMLHRVPDDVAEPALSIASADTPIPLQAGFDDPAWQLAAAQTTFATCATDGAQPVTMQTRLAFDQDGLYVVARVEGAGDVVFTDDDVLEITVRVQRSEGVPCQFAFTPSGRIEGRFAWNTPYAKGRALRLNERVWEVSLTARWAQLGISAPQPDMKVGLTFSHAEDIASVDHASADYLRSAVSFYQGLITIPAAPVAEPAPASATEPVAPEPAPTVAPAPAPSTEPQEPAPATDSAAPTAESAPASEPVTPSPAPAAEPAATPAEQPATVPATQPAQE
jgi:hypothetical protein